MAGVAVRDSRQCAAVSVEQVGRVCRSRYGGTDRLSTYMGLLQSRAGVGRSDGGDVGELGLSGIAG